MTTYETPRRKMGKKGAVLEECLAENSLFLFQDETLSPIFCKSKLIPLKTITMQKLEKMQQEMMEKLKIPVAEEEQKAEEEHGEQPSTSTEEPKATDVWTADD